MTAKERLIEIVGGVRHTTTNKELADAIISDKELIEQIVRERVVIDAGRVGDMLATKLAKWDNDCEIIPEGEEYKIAEAIAAAKDEILKIASCSN